MKKLRIKKLFEADGQLQQPVQQQLNNNQQQLANGQLQQQLDNNGFNALELIQKISNLQVAAVQALQETYNKVAQDIPELDVAAKDNNSPINKEAKELIDAIAGFTKGLADVNKPDTITAAMTSYGNIADKMKAFITKISETATSNQQQNNNQPAQQLNNQQLAQQLNNQLLNNQLQNNNQQLQQPVPQTNNNLQQQLQNVGESHKVNTFGKTLNEKIRTANFNKMLNSIEEF